MVGGARLETSVLLLLYCDDSAFKKMSRVRRRGIAWDGSEREGCFSQQIFRQSVRIGEDQKRSIAKKILFGIALLL